MTVSLLDQLLPPDRRTREIDNYYHLQMIATGTQELAAYQASVFDAQREAAHDTLQTLHGLAEVQAATQAAVKYLSGSLDELLAISIETGRVLQTGFTELAEQMLSQQKALQEISDVLRRPYETQARELLREADRAIKSGSTRIGPEREADFADAQTLLRQVLENPIGRRNDIAWFQIGWLRWKGGELRDAEEAFFHAARLSAERQDLYYMLALRHLAHIQSLQGKDPEARQTIEKARRVAPDDPDVMYEAARYAARLSLYEEAFELIRAVLPQRPHICITMFAEPDFLGMAESLARWMLERTTEVRIEATKAAQTWQQTLTLVSEAERVSGYPLVSFVPGEADETVRKASTADYTAATVLREQATRRASELRDRARTILQDELSRNFEAAQHARNRASRELQQKLESARHASALAINQKRDEFVGYLQLAVGLTMFFVVGGVVIWATDNLLLAVLAAFSSLIAAFLLINKYAMSRGPSQRSVRLQEAERRIEQTAEDQLRKELTVLDGSVAAVREAVLLLSR